MIIVYFFFQAEDGIRDFHVTGVQTCALPISSAGVGATWNGGTLGDAAPAASQRATARTSSTTPPRWARRPMPARSEERRVGKECRGRWSADHKKKKEDEEKRKRRQIDGGRSR